MMKNIGIFMVTISSFIFFIGAMHPFFVSAEMDKEELIRRSIEQGNKYLREGNYREALKEWAAGLEIDPGNSTLNSLITITKVQMREEKEIQIKNGTKYFFGEPGKALKAWEAVLRIDPDDADAKENVKRLNEEINKRIKVLASEAEERLRRGEFLYARDSTMEILKIDPGSAIGNELVERIKDAYTQELKKKLKNAQDYYYNGSYKKAIEILEDLVMEKMLDPMKDTPNAYIFLGYSYGAIGEDGKAIENFKNALRFDPRISISPEVPLRIHNMFDKARKGGER